MFSSRKIDENWGSCNTPLQRYSLACVFVIKKSELQLLVVNKEAVKLLNNTLYKVHDQRKKHASSVVWVFRGGVGHERGGGPNQISSPPSIPFPSTPSCPLPFSEDSSSRHRKCPLDKMCLTLCYGCFYSKQACRLDKTGMGNFPWSRAQPKDSSKLFSNWLKKKIELVTMSWSAH